MCPITEHKVSLSWLETNMPLVHYKEQMHPYQDISTY